jgi:hypothetical protein
LIDIPDLVVLDKGHYLGESYPFATTDYRIRHFPLTIGGVRRDSPVRLLGLDPDSGDSGGVFETGRKVQEPGAVLRIPSAPDDRRSLDKLPLLPDQIHQMSIGEVGFEFPGQHQLGDGVRKLSDQADRQAGADGDAGKTTYAGSSGKIGQILMVPLTGLSEMDETGQTVAQD